jgi:hypothetical protein
VAVFDIDPCHVGVACRCCSCCSTFHSLSVTFERRTLFVTVCSSRVRMSECIIIMRVSKQQSPSISRSNSFRKKRARKRACNPLLAPGRCYFCGGVRRTIFFFDVDAFHMLFFPLRVHKPLSISSTIIISNTSTGRHKQACLWSIRCMIV